MAHTFSLWWNVCQRTNLDVCWIWQLKVFNTGQIPRLWKRTLLSHIGSEVISAKEEQQCLHRLAKSRARHGVARTTNTAGLRITFVRLVPAAVVGQRAR